mmetsp:Transcript_41198/g.104836  ORF Transcript_41198/g.104836 Transcript_41198/m.104836 type:complete len:407 (-) Transcript_41198:52-1272(-)
MCPAHAVALHGAMATATARDELRGGGRPRDERDDFFDRMAAIEERVRALHAPKAQQPPPPSSDASLGGRGLLGLSLEAPSEEEPRLGARLPTLLQRQGLASEAKLGSAKQQWQPPPEVAEPGRWGEVRAAKTDEVATTGIPDDDRCLPSELDLKFKELDSIMHALQFGGDASPSSAAPRPSVRVTAGRAHKAEELRRSPSPVAWRQGRGSDVHLLRRALAGTMSQSSHSSSRALPRPRRTSSHEESDEHAASAVAVALGLAGRRAEDAAVLVRSRLARVAARIDAEARARSVGGVSPRRTSTLHRRRAELCEGLSSCRQEGVEFDSGTRLARCCQELDMLQLRGLGTAGDGDEAAAAETNVFRRGTLWLWRRRSAARDADIDELLRGGSELGVDELGVSRLPSMIC